MPHSCHLKISFSEKLRDEGSKERAGDAELLGGRLPLHQGAENRKQVQGKVNFLAAPVGDFVVDDYLAEGDLC